MKNNIMLKSNNIAFKITFTAVVVFLIAISILTGVSLKVTSKDMEKQMQMDGIGLAEEIADEIEIGNIAVKQMNNLLCDKIKTVSYLIGQTANVSNENLMKLANNTQITEVNIANPQGVIVNSNMDANIGYRYPDNHAVQAVLKGKEKNIVEEIRKSDIDGKYYKYGAVALDNGGIIQVGILADKVQELQSYVNTQKMVESIAKKENIDYAVVIDKNLVAIANSDKSKIGATFKDKGSKIAVKDGKMYCSKYITDKGETVYDVIVPLFIEGKHTGAVDIGISMNTLNNALKDIIFKSVIIAIISFLIGGYILSFIIKRMIKPLKEVADIANKVSNGDLTCKVDIKGNDEISVLAKSFNIMIDNLRNITSKIQDVASDVSSYSQELLSSSQQASSASEQIAISIQDIAAGAEKQVNATNEVSNNIREVVYSMTKIQSEVNNVVGNANDTSKLALDGREKMNKMINQINTIKDSVNYSSNVMYELEATSDEIGGIVQVINDIADQTNLLALNAAIEAARAGESGKGFAVVADEIRNLAEQSMKSADKIRDLIIKTQENTKKALDSIGKGNKEADEGELIVKEVGISLKQILDGFDITKHKLYEVNENIIISNKNAEYIVGVVEQIEGVSTDSAANTEEVAASTEQQAATIEQISGAVEQLTNMAMDLEDIVKMFKI